MLGENPENDHGKEKLLHELGKCLREGIYDKRVKEKQCIKKKARDIIGKLLQCDEQDLINFIRAHGCTVNADEIWGKVCLICICKVHTLRNPRLFYTWLRKITRYQICHWIAEQKKKRRLLTSKELSVFPSDKPTALEELIKKEEDLTEKKRKELTNKWIYEKAKDSERQIILAHFIDKMSYKEIAEKRGMKFEAVKAILERAPAKIGKYIKEQEGEKF